MSDDQRLFFYVTVLICTFSLFLRWRSETRAKSSGPPYVSGKIPLPYVGHLPGIITQRMAYFQELGTKWRAPLISVSILGTDIYVVGSVKLLPSIQRQPKVLSSWFFVAQFVPRMVGATKRSLESFSANMSVESQGQQMLLEGNRVTKRIMASQTGTEMSRIAARMVNDRLNGLMEGQKGELIVELWDWVKHEITLSVSESIYGPGNPYRDPKVEAGFWKFVDQSLWLSATSFLPTAIVSKALSGYDGREVFVKAMDDYFVSGAHKEGSPLVNAHYPLFKEGLDHPEIARFECANGLGTLANTAPTAFWTIFHTFSDPNTLEEVRNQIDSITTSELCKDSNKIMRRINLGRLREAPILLSAVEEASRYRATGIGVRMVMEDTVVGENDYQYHLKKGGVLVIANQAIHSDKDVWGENAETYLANRFCSKTPQYGFRGFGNGATACCGKNFAMFQVASLLAMLVIRYNVTPVTGKWYDPGQDGRNSAAQVSPPQKRTMVKITRRQDEEAVLWDFIF